MKKIKKILMNIITNIYVVITSILFVIQWFLKQLWNLITCKNGRL